ncbi:hypothetical protein OAO19_03035 [Gammaproteobacteria bacterium]|nr:hypothetical protein [Gammaproteobacteria bacterium]
MDTTLVSILITKVGMGDASLDSTESTMYTETSKGVTQNQKNARGLKMMSWNYRVVKIKEDDEYIFTIAEVYYDDDGDIIATTAEPVGAMGEDLKELALDLKNMVDALSKPVIDATELFDPKLELH